MKAVVAAFNQEKALVGAFSMIVKTDCETDGSSAAQVATHYCEIDNSRSGTPPSASAAPAPAAVLQKVPSEANPKVRNHGEGPY